MRIRTAVQRGRKARALVAAGGVAVVLALAAAPAGTQMPHWAQQNSHLRHSGHKVGR